MSRYAVRCIGLVLAAGISCRADLTLRYSSKMEFGPGMPRSVVEAVKQQGGTFLAGRVLQFKGDKTLSESGPITIIMDNARAEITLMNPATKQYARMSMGEYMNALRTVVATPLAAAQQALDRMKFDVKTDRTGQVAIVSGIRADEHLTTLSVSMDIPGGTGPATVMTMEIRTWLALPEDLNRIPALQEYAGHVQRAVSVFDSGGEATRMFTQMPIIGNKLRDAMAELTKNSGGLLVKMRETMSMPAMAQMAQGVNASMEMSSDLTGVSSEAMDDALFNVPPDYQLGTADELVKALKPPAPPVPAGIASGLRMAPGPAGPPAPMVRDLPAGEEVSRVGRGVSAPQVIFKRDPEYSQEARRAKVSGTVLLSVVVDKEGSARNIQVMRGIGLGLDEKAVEAVRQWTFRPAANALGPVNAQAQIEVNFRLLVDPPQ